MRESRHRAGPPTPVTSQDDRIEALLLEGLDRYFEGRYDDAIHLWTRLLFIDRNHARARAYINRARTALAERQRRADELLASAEDHLERGAFVEVRRLIGEGERLGGADARAAELWARLDRAERASRTLTRPSAPAAVLDVRPVGSWRAKVRAVSQLAAAGAFGVLAVAIATSPYVRSWFTGESAPLVQSTSRPESLTILGPADVALARARSLYRRGRPAEALRALDAVAAGGAVETREIEQLRLEIQAVLLAGRTMDRSQ
jgi:tetratricopeptide (TPR) repeat protein